MIRNRYIAIKTVLAAAAASGSATVGAETQDPFAEFKRLGVKTECRLLTPGEQQAASGLTDFAIRAAYNCARAEMREAYQRSGLATAADYAVWANFSTAPYRSKTHADRYVNNYANRIAAIGYSTYGDSAALPAGSILAKDSFYVDADGQVFIGALYLMEKMSTGYNPRYNDWRYTMVLADGTVFMSLGGTPSSSVKFCGDCHQEVGISDSLFFVPEPYRFPSRPRPQTPKP